MMLRALIDGLTITPLQWPASGQDVRVCDITEDSRTVMPGSLFVARCGEKSDGRAFVPQAIAAGASAILTDDPNLKLPPAGANIDQVKAMLFVAAFPVVVRPKKMANAISTFFMSTSQLAFLPVSRR